MVVWRDLRDWLKEVEKIGELVRISEEVDWDEELSAITYLTGKKIGGPALLCAARSLPSRGHRGSRHRHA